MTDQTETTAHALMFNNDLFFGSKVTGTANAIGLKVELEADIPRGLSRIAAGDYRCIFLDLALPGLVPADVTAAVAELDAERRPRVIAFGSHVDTARLDESRAAGCDEVMPRSRFSAELVQILSHNCSR